MTDEPSPPPHAATELDNTLLRLRRAMLVFVILFLVPPLLLLGIKKESAAFLLVLFSPGWISCLWIWRDLRAGKARRALAVMSAACAFVILVFSAVCGVALDWIWDPIVGHEDTAAAGWIGLFLGAVVIFIMVRAYRDARSLRRQLSPPVSVPRMNWGELILGLCGVMVALAVFAAMPPHPRNSNDAAAAGNLHTLNTSLVTYTSTYGTFPPSLAALGPGKPGAEGTPAAAGLIDADLASGVKRDYRFQYEPGPAENGVIRKYSLHADPLDAKRPWERHFYTDESGVIRFELKKEATAASAPLS